MLTVILSLALGSTAFAADPPASYVTPADPVPANLSIPPVGVVGSRTAGLAHCANVTVEGHMSKAYAAEMARICAAEREAEISLQIEQSRVDGQTTVADIDAVTRLHLGNTVPMGGSAYAHNGMIATGDAARVAAEFDNLKPGTLGMGVNGTGYNGFVVGRTFSGMDAFDALDGNGGVSGGHNTQTTTPPKKPADKPDTTVPAPADPMTDVQRADADAKAVGDAAKIGK